MSRDIRSFFKPLQHKKKAPVLSDDEIIEDSPAANNKKNKTPRGKSKLIPISPTHEKLKPVNAMDLFGKSPVKQSKLEGKVKGDKELKRKSDFNKTVQDLDDEMDFDWNDLDKTVEETLKVNPNANCTKTPITPKVKANAKKRKAEDLNESSILSDQEKFEIKQSNYMRYINRGDPPNKGKKELPEGSFTCLAGLCFLKTGVLDSLDSEELNTLVMKCGGRTVKAVSKKVNYLVVGEEPGPSKLEKARSLGIPEISEDDLLDMILVRSGKSAKYKNAANNGNGMKHSPEQEAPNKKRKIAVDDSPKKRKAELPMINVTPKKAKETPSKIVIEHDSSERKTLLPRTSPRKSNKLLDSEVKQAPITATVNTVTKIMSTPSVNVVKISEDNKSWTEKYKPANIKEIIGQQDKDSNMNKLMYWLSHWNQCHGAGKMLKLTKPSPWEKNNNGSYFKAALLSGAPGVGKTTTATLVAKELGYDVVEFNASDTRSKKLLQEEVTALLSTKSLITYFQDGSAPTNKHVLLMDEVDGMSGNQDRGGIQELIVLIKNSNIPIICICNDRQHPKIRSLANYCFDLRFNKIKPEVIRGNLMSVCFKEGVKIKSDALLQMIVSTGSDIRQTLNHLSMWSATNKCISNDSLQKDADASKKDVVLGPWDVIRKVFTADDQKTKMDEKSKLFFYDYNIAPLFVQENYLQVQPNGKNPLKCAALAADAISMGDVIETKIRSSNNWELLDSQAFHSSVMPGHYMSGKFRAQIMFPSWLGKNSKGGKFRRFATELHSHMRLSASTSKDAINLDYIYMLRDNFVNPLIMSGIHGVSESLQMMKDYNLLREDLDSILELAQWSKQKDPMSKVESKVKAAFTRAYNKDAPILPYSIDTVSKKKSVIKDDVYGEEDDNNDSDEDDDDIGNDAMIKAKAKTKARGKAKTTESAPISSTSSRQGTAEATTSKKPGTKGKGKKAK